MAEPRFELIPIDCLHIHEEVVPAEVAHLVTTLAASRIVREPVLVADGSLVILNGHHRVAALQALGARSVPAWIVDYEDDGIALDRWDDGPPLTKSDVVARARSGRPFPPKTTRHRVLLDLPERPTALSDLGVPKEIQAHPNAPRRSR